MTGIPAGRNINHEQETRTMNSTAPSRLLDALDQAESAIGGDESEMRAVLIQLTDIVRDELGKADPAETGRMAAEAEHAARTMAPPVPDVTENSGRTVRAALPGHPAGGGLLQSWWVACESISGHWVTWEAYKMDGRQAGFLAYNAGTYFGGPDPAANKNQALADLAARAGLLRDVAPLLADEILRHHPEHGPWNLIQKRERQLAGALRTWAAGRLPDGV